MRPTERGQAIAFLLSIGAIPLGCPAEDDGESDTNATSPTTTAGSTASTSAGTEGTDSDASMSSNATSTAPTTASTTESSTASTTVSTDATDVSVGTDPDTGYGTYGSGGDPCKGIDIPEICSQYAAHYLECYPGLRRYEEFKAYYCACMITYYGPTYGPNCATALEDYFACLTEVPCELIGGEACMAEDDAMVTACGGGDDSGVGE